MKSAVELGATGTIDQVIVKDTSVDYRIISNVVACFLVKRHQE